ncbi:MAG: hypothetical protein JSS89_13335 [Bacteroidetes bacterium]|nr:hypothetical protein [Bacteroidota bacterium]
MDRFLGTTAEEMQTVATQLTTINTATDFTVGDQINNGTEPQIIDCAAIEKRGHVELVGVTVLEKYTSGSAIKMGMRIWFFDKTFVAAGKDAPMQVPTPETLKPHTLRYVDIVTGDYVDLTDGGSSPKWTFAQLDGLSKSLRCASDTRALYYLCEAKEAKHFASGATLDILFHFRPH